MPYNAFISYSHNADSALAAALQSALHRFAKPWYKLRALHIFRDQTNLAVNPALWTSIRDALDQSFFFILLASPESCASPWVGKEADYWLNRNGSSKILIVLTGGDLEWDNPTASFPAGHTVLPPGLLHAFAEEPLFLDLRWARETAPPYRLREPRFHEAILQLASTLHNRPKDELDGADIRARRHTRLLAAFAVLAIVLVALFAYRQSGRTDDEIRRNLAAALASESAKVLHDNPDRAGDAALLAIESNRLNPTFNGNQALRAAVALLPSGAQSYPPPDANPTERIRDLSFSPSGSLLALARDDGSTQLIDVANHKPVGFFSPDEHPAASIEIPTDSQNSPDDDAAVSVAFNSSGSMLASASRDGLVHVWTVPAGRELLRITHNAAVAQVAFNPKANQLITASDDGHVRIFDVARSTMTADFKCPDKAVAAIFSPAGDIAAAFSADGSVSLIDPATGKLLRTLSGGEAAFNLAFSADGKRLAASGGDFAFVWDVPTGQQLLKATHAASSETLTPQQWILNAAISPDGKFLAYAARGDKSAHVWNIDTGRAILEIKHDSAVAAVAFNADGSKLGTGSYDGTARVWQLPSGIELERTSHPGGAEVVAFTPSGGRFAAARFAAGGVDGSLSVSETRRADRPVFFDVPSEVRSVAFSPDGHQLALGTVSAHHSPLVEIASINGEILHEIEFHGAPVIDKLYFPNANQLIAQWSNKLFLIAANPPSATPLPESPGDKRIERSGHVMAVQQDAVSKLYALPGMKEIASLSVPNAHLLGSGADGRLAAFETGEPPATFFVDIWNVASNSRVTRVRLPAELNRSAVNANGALLFTAEGKNLQVWDIPSGNAHHQITASDDIDVLVPNPSSSAVATITHGRIAVWDTLSGERLAELPDTGYIRAAAFSPDGLYLLTGYDEHSAALWLWRSNDLRDQACARLTHNLSREEWSRSLPNQPYRQTCLNLPAEK